MKSVINESDFNVDSGLYAIKFWSTWCKPCKLFSPKVDSLDEEFNDITFLSVDIDQVPTLAQKYKIHSLPTLLIIKNGTEASRIEGLQLLAPMRKILRELAGTPQVAEVAEAKHAM
ncbi:MAG: thioredoxin family protein [bacterium]|nr:thioredoxin family protein [bacterium]